MTIRSCLVDTNVILRATRRSDPQHQTVSSALEKLIGRSVSLHYTHQNIAEFWNTLTRPIERNGLGLTVAETEREVRAIETGMTLLPDSEAVYKEWRRLVLELAISGVQVHDARLAASMYVHGVTHILTFNTADFVRFVGVAALNPTFV
jgi:predicted nucleic acid-binding protein